MKFNYKQLKQNRLCVYHIFDTYKIKDVFDIDGYDIFCKSKYESTDTETVVNKFHFDVYKLYSNTANSIVNLEPSIGDRIKWFANKYTFVTSQEGTIKSLREEIDNEIIKMLSNANGWNGV